MVLLFRASDYINDLERETFLELKPFSRNMSTIYRDRLYVMLSKINHYRLAKRVNASLELIIFKFHSPLEETSFDVDMRLVSVFGPALSHGLLKIHTVVLSYEESLACGAFIEQPIANVSRSKTA